MTLSKILIGASLFAFCSFAQAYTSDDEQIDDVIRTVESASQPRKEQVLERLQWSGLDDARLYDVFEQDLLDNYKKMSFETNKARTLAYEVRALGYSGNQKYLDTLQLLSKDTKNPKLKKYARKAKEDFPQFLDVQDSLATVTYEHAELPSEVVNYIRLFKTENAYAQRLAARAAFHEYKNEPELLDLMAEKLRQSYMSTSLNREEEDMIAWLCKVLIRAGSYQALIQEVADKTPSRKIKKYATKSY